MSPRNVQTRVLKRSVVVPLAPSHTIAGKIRMMHTASKTPFSMMPFSMMPFSMVPSALSTLLPPTILSI